MKANREMFWDAWTYYRIGHGQYWGHFLGLANFLLVIYLSLMAYFESIGIDMPPTVIMMFVAVFVPFYVTTSVWWGWKHTKKMPYKRESIVKFDNNPRMAEMRSDIKKIMERLDDNA